MAGAVTLEQLHTRKAEAQRKLVAAQRAIQALARKERAIARQAQQAQWLAAGKLLEELGYPITDLAALKYLLERTHAKADA